MSLEAKAHLDRELASSQFRLGDFISSGFNLWKKGYWAFFGFSLLFMVISMVVGLIPVVGQAVNQLILAPILTAGAYMYCHHLQRDQHADFELFFSQFKGNGQLFLVYLMYTLILLLCSVPFLLLLGFNFIEVFGMNDPQVVLENFEHINYGAFPLLLLPFFMTILLSYCLHFVIFYKLSAVDALSYSFKFCLKHVFLIFAFFLVSILIMISGVIGLVIGMLFTWHVIWPLSYESFRLLTNLSLYEQGDDQQETIDQLIA